MPTSQRYLTAREAAAHLGITPATLYAYVSRGLLHSEQGSGSTRARRYLLADVEALAARKEYRRTPAKAAETALTFGLPVLDSAITLIDDGRLYYRGHDVRTLARTRTFEEVAALLWTGDFAAADLFSAAPPPLAAQTAPMPAAEILDSPIEHYQAVLALAAPDDLAAHRHTGAAVARTGARILTLLTGATVDPAGATPPGGAPGDTLAATLQRAWSPAGTPATPAAPATPSAAKLLSAALILCADHELNVSAFTARCVASAGSSPYAVVIAALSALQGYRHGGHTAAAAALLSAAATDGVRATVGAYLGSGSGLPGFGHPLYPDGDPRARCLLDLLHAHHPASQPLQIAHDLCAAAHTALGEHPTIDFALAALAATLGAPRHAPLALFALGRTAGWLAHAIEQYTLNQLIRPRARYVGPPPQEEA